MTYIGEEIVESFVIFLIKACAKTTKKKHVLIKCKLKQPSRPLNLLNLPLESVRQAEDL